MDCEQTALVEVVKQVPDILKAFGALATALGTLYVLRTTRKTEEKVSSLTNTEQR